MPFDAREAKQLKPGEHIKFPEHPGLRLTATQTTRPWQYRYKSPVDSKMRQVKLGEWPAMSFNRAVVEWEAKRQARSAGIDEAAEKVARRAEERERLQADKAVQAQALLTVRVLCDAYWEGHLKPHRSAKSAGEVKRLFDKDLGDLADVPAHEVSRAQAFQLIDAMAKRAPVLANQLRKELGSAWDYGVDSGRLPEQTPNWWRKVLKGKIKSKGKKIAGQRVGVGKRHLHDDEVAVLLPWLENFTQVVADVLILYLWTATRGVEIVAMMGCEVEEGADVWWWTIPKAKTKNAHVPDAVDLRVPLFGRALEVVKRRKQLYGDGYLFLGEKRRKLKALPHVKQHSICAAVYWHQPYCAVEPEVDRPRLPVTHWAPHDLRRTARTMLSALGCSKEVAEAILGHVPEKMEATYNLYTFDPERLHWLAKLSDHLERLATR